MYNKSSHSSGRKPFSSRSGPSAGSGYKPSRFGRGRPSSGGGSRFGGGRGAPRRGGPKGDYIDPSKFINKAIITEEVEHFVPEHKFHEFNLLPELKQAIVAKGYVLPTPIQDRAIPHILKETDVVGIANTGTGKTAAFLIPLINKVLHNRKENILIVVPTRELAIQIEQELKGFTKGMKIFSVCCVGGANIGLQIRDLRYHNNFVIGTPGRLKDLIERKVIHLSFFKNIVLDEADRMLDMGFIADMRFLMAGMQKDRQTLFFSATLSSEIEKLIKEFLREPVRISVKTSDTAKTVDQDVVKVPKGGSKLDVLHDLLKQKEFSKVLIFGKTKHGVEKLSKMLAERGFKAESIHGNKTHGNRQRSLKLFKDSHIQVLVATDVAARGLDIADVSHVINFDIPATYDDYVHRIGRTGRANKKGKALTFI
ncbi:MAG: DEAD/DEAH box helicase [Parcubacteria group bacterium]|nr:DEAD/DEAH box helicase [Parcubacteria group bacterium]